jgi:hypothetical protein
LPTEDYCTTADDNTFELHSRAAYSTTKSSSRDNYFDASYFEDVRDNTLRIEQDPNFVNIGCRLELGEESDSVLTSDEDDDDDDMYGPAVDCSFLSVLCSTSSSSR